MSTRLFWRAVAIQAGLTGGLFAVLVVTVPHHFFTRWGIVVGPLIWIGCSLLTGRLLRLPIAFALFCAVAGGLAGTLAGLVFGHPVGIVAGVGVFAACASGYGRPGSEDPRPRGDEHAADVARG